MNEIKNFWTLTKTGFLEKKEKTIKETLILGLKLFLILIATKIIYIGIFYCLEYYNILDLPKRISSEKLKSYSGIMQLFIVAIYAPIFEELVFRIGLIFSKLNFTIISIGIIYLILRVIIKLELIYCVIIPLVFGLIVYLSIGIKTIEWLSKFWKNNRRKIFYSFLLLFGLIHLGNYESTSELWKYSLILIIPHIIGGFIYSYARLNSGIILAIGIHSINNGFPQLMKLITE